MGDHGILNEYARGYYNLPHGPTSGFQSQAELTAQDWTLVIPHSHEPEKYKIGLSSLNRLSNPAYPVFESPSAHPNCPGGVRHWIAFTVVDMCISLNHASVVQGIQSSLMARAGSMAQYRFQGPCIRWYVRCLFSSRVPEIWSKKFKQIQRIYNFDQFWSILINFDQFWSILINSLYISLSRSELLASTASTWLHLELHGT